MSCWITHTHYIYSIDFVNRKQDKQYIDNTKSYQFKLREQNEQEPSLTNRIDFKLITTYNVNDYKSW